MVQYLVPPNQKPSSLAPSLLKSPAKQHQSQLKIQSHSKNPHSSRAIRTQVQVTDKREAPLEAPYDTTYETGNPTVVPKDLLKQFQFAFLIRHPRKSIPSYYRCCIPPLSDLTGFEGFRPDETGYKELRRTFDYLSSINGLGEDLRGPKREKKLSSSNGIEASFLGQSTANICVMDADDLLSAPEKVLEMFCSFIDIKFSPTMLNWDNAEDQKIAAAAFEKWKGFHEDAVHSKGLKPREKKEDERTDEDYFEEWVEKYGYKAARVIQKAVADNMADYNYMKQFAIRV